MATFPFFLQFQYVLTANGTGTVQYPVPPNEKLELSELRFVSTGAFSVTDIRDSTGKHFTNASSAVPILSTLLQNAQNGYISAKDFDVPLEVGGNVTFYMDLKDTSGAGNTVNLLLTGVKTTT